MNLLLWTNHVTEHHLPLIESLKTAGFDGVELPLGEGNITDYRTLGEQINSLGLGMTAVISLDTDTNIASPDAKHRAAGLDRLKWAIDCCNASGAEILCGPYHSAFAYFSRKPPTPDERRWSVEVLNKAADYAADAQVILAPEALNRFECYLCNTMADLKAMVEDVNNPYLGAIYDTHHANIEEKSHADAIRTIAPYLKHVHISESDRGTPGKGQINWNDVFSTLKEVGYDQWLTIEAFSTVIPEFANAINVWRDFSPAEEIYTEGVKFIKQQWNNA